MLIYRLSLTCVLALLYSTSFAQTPEITYSSATDGYTEIISSNNGTVEGVLTATLSGATFSNASGTLSSPDDFRFTNLTYGLEATATVSADGTIVTITLEQYALSHQPINNIPNLIISFKDTAFSEVESSEVTNADQFTGYGITFVTNPRLNYTGNDFLEVTANDGSLSGTHTVNIENGNFANAGSTLNYGDDFEITNLPAGLSAVAAVSADGSTLTITMSGYADQHQIADNEDQLYYVFDNTAFDGGILASSVFYYRSYAPSGIVFNNNPALYYSSESNLNSDLNIQDLKRTDKDSYYLGDDRFEFGPSGTLLFSADNNGIQAYQLENPYDFSAIEAVEGNVIEVDDLIDFEFGKDGKTLFVMSLVQHYYEVIKQYELSSAFDLSTASIVSDLEFDPLDLAFEELSNGEFDTSLGGFDATGFTLNSDGSKVFVTVNRGGVMEFSLPDANDMNNVVFNSVFHTASNEYGKAPFSISFSSSGDYVFIGDETSILGYQLSTAFDISSISFNENNKIILESIQEDFLLVDDETFYLLEGGYLNEYSFHADVFREKETDDGILEGSMIIKIVNAVFHNTSDDLEYNTDYTITNLPSGLEPVLSVSADGSQATLVLNGASTMHTREEDVDGLIFSFENSAFNSVVDVKDFLYATEANSNIPIRFSWDDTVPPIATLSTPVTTGASESTFPITVTFSEPVYDFQQEDILIDPIENFGTINEEIKNFTINEEHTSYTFDFITKSGDAMYGLRLFSLSVYDASGNGNLIGDTLLLKTGDFRNNKPVVKDQTFTVPKGAPVGTIFGQLVASDADSDILEISIYNSDNQLNINDYFYVNDFNELVVNSGVNLDPEIIDTFEFIINADDGIFDSEAKGIIYVAGVLDVDYSQELVGIEIFPIPTTDIINVKGYKGTSLSYSILDLAGNMIRTNTVMDHANVIDIADLKTGFYIMVLNTKRERRQVKIQKL